MIELLSAVICCLL